MKKEKVLNMIIAVFTVLCALVAFTGAFFRYVFPVLLAKKYNIDTRNASSVGFIGSADGPTSIFISGGSLYRILTATCSILAILGAVYLIINFLHRHNINNCF